MTNEEGGVDPDESMYEVLVDRVNTTATVWLGINARAAPQCHNHKYDPFSQKDYFRLLAFFANTDYESRTFGDGTRYFEARLDLATPEQEQERASEFRRRSIASKLELKTPTPALREAQEQWEQVAAAGGSVVGAVDADEQPRHERRHADARGRMARCWRPGRTRS